MEVYSLVSRTKRNSPGFHTITPRSQDLSTHKPSQLPGENTAWFPFVTHGSYSSTQAFTVLPRTHWLLGWDSAHVGKGLAQENNVTANSAQLVTQTCKISLASCTRNHWAMMPHNWGLQHRDPSALKALHAGPTQHGTVIQKSLAIICTQTWNHVVG